MVIGTIIIRGPSENNYQMTGMGVPWEQACRVETAQEEEPPEFPQMDLCGVYSAIFFEANAKRAWGGPLITSAMWFEARSYRHALAAAYPGRAWFQFEVSVFGIFCVASSMDPEVVNSPMLLRVYILPWFRTTTE